VKRCDAGPDAPGWGSASLLGLTVAPMTSNTRTMWEYRGREFEREQLRLVSLAPADRNSQCLPDCRLCAEGFIDDGQPHLVDGRWYAHLH